MLYRIWPLLKEVYHYEKHSTLDSDYLRQVLTLAVVVLFALNFSCNGLDSPSSSSSPGSPALCC